VKILVFLTPSLEQDLILNSYFLFLMTNPKTWSDRFKTALHPAIATFNASIGFDIELIEYDLSGSIAHAKMLAKTGIISSDEGEKLVAGLEQIRQEYRQGNFHPGVEAEDVHFAVERRLTEIAGDVGKKLHTWDALATIKSERTLASIFAIKFNKFVLNSSTYNGFYSIWQTFTLKRLSPVIRTSNAPNL